MLKSENLLKLLEIEDKVYIMHHYYKNLYLDEYFVMSFFIIFV